MSRSSHKSVLLLGATSEIGFAILKKLVGPNTERVVMSARDAAMLVSKVNELKQRDVPNVATFNLDALDFANHEAIVADCIDKYGPFDLVIIAFGVLHDDIVTTIGTNFTGTATILRALVNHMRNNDARIVVLSSVAGVRVRAGNYVYGSSKAGIDGYCQGLADSIVGCALRLLIVRPGFVETKMTHGRKKQPFTITSERAADYIVDGILHDRDVIWAPPFLRWAFVIIRMMPQRLYRRLSAFS